MTTPNSKPVERRGTVQKIVLVVVLPVAALITLAMIYAVVSIWLLALAMMTG